jgi:hypothetical protein
VIKGLDNPIFPIYSPPPLNGNTIMKPATRYQRPTTSRMTGIDAGRPCFDKRWEENRP